MDTPLGSVLYITLGCAKNEVDTDRMRSLLTAAGYEEAFDPQDADIAIVNTCSFLASATSESIETTLELANEVQDGVRACPIVMCGCVPSRYGDDLPDELPEVAAFVKADEEDGIVSVIDGVLGVEREIAAYIPQVKRTVEGAVAYVKISDGCNRFCSFCMIPYIRGRYHSRNAESIISEVRDLVAGGVREIVLIGQDTGIWGTDFADEDVAEGSPRNLAQLLRAVAEAVRPHNVWVRVLYLQPEGMTDELIDTIRDTPEVLPYIDIPVQHCDARILKAMRRSGSRQELEDLFRDLRERIPGIVIRSTAMVGFPTETDDEFRDLIDFMDTVGFDYTSVFAYSREEGSLAAKMEGQVDEEVKLERAQEAMDLAESLGFAATAAHVGERAQVIVDGIEETEDGAELIGHAWFQAPDSDGAVHLDAIEASVGDILTVEFTDSFCYELIGHVVEQESVVANESNKELTSVWTPANIVTCVRIVFIPVFMIVSALSHASVAGTDWSTFDGPLAAAAFILYVILSCTDKVDGYLARSRNEITDFGKFLDPIADKLLVFSALLLFLDFGMVTVWSVFIILFRELLVSALRMVASAAGVVVAADKLGKYKTATTMVSICGYLCVFAMTGLQLGPAELLLGVYGVSRFLYAVAVVLTVISGAQYFWNCRKIIFSV